MGEYAIRKSDGERIKIGTCEEMYYLRFEDREKVQATSGNVDPVKDAGELRFRLPFPDEDHIQPGNYEDFSRGVRLHCKGEDFADADAPAGSFQMRHEPSGLLLGVKCYHGAKLPEASEDFKPFWNGKSWAMELRMLRGVRRDDGAIRAFPVVACRFCGEQWRYQWAQIWEYLTPEWQERFHSYAALSVIDHDADKVGA